jgi:hypothetical protein
MKGGIVCIITGPVFIGPGPYHPALAALSFIRSEEIDYARARNAAKDSEIPSLQRFQKLAAAVVCGLPCDCSMPSAQVGGE